MTTTRTLTAKQGGPITLTAKSLALFVTTETDPTLTHAEITIATTDDTGPSADAVNNAIIRDTGSEITIDIPNQGVSIGGGGMQFNSFSGGGVIIGNGGVVNIGGGVVIGDMVAGNVYIGGKRVSGGSAVVIPPTSPITVTAKLPANSRLNVSSTSGDTRTIGHLDHVMVDSKASGDIFCDQVNTVQVNTISGDINVNHVMRSARLKTVSGDIAVYGDEDVAVTAETVSGDVVHGRNLDVSARSVSGRIRSVKR